MNAPSGSQYMFWAPRPTGAPVEDLADRLEEDERRANEQIDARRRRRRVATIAPASATGARRASGSSSSCRRSAVYAFAFQSCCFRFAKVTDSKRRREYESSTRGSAPFDLSC